MNAFIVNQFKRAVSPLIATIVLISFTIAIGSLVINWGKQFITAQTQALEQAGVECNKENIQIVKVTANVTNSTKTNFTLIAKNIGDVKFSLGSVNVYTENKVYSNNSISFDLEKGEADSFSVVFAFNASKEEVSYIELTSKNCPNNVYYFYTVEVK